MSKMQPRRCRRCQGIFIPIVGNQVYCSRECNKKANNAKHRANIKRDQGLPVDPDYGCVPYAVMACKKAQTLAECVRIAREYGMTYGEAVNAGLFKEV